ncbi:hypothetical protein Pmani_037026 [Petrolisthes manimaculis]|uniref:Uncharacterized protein n=1 Tax=Petrolisthes manimaculis TaxID=1843537 RepID=A0AAE1NHP1_9EUCA|nr:hypothetical protein Pmani_037026 [Petrolisthes manimaculis]
MVGSNQVSIVRSSNSLIITCHQEQEVRLRKDLNMKSGHPQQVMSSKSGQLLITSSGNDKSNVGKLINNNNNNNNIMKSGQMHKVKSGQVYLGKPGDDVERKANKILKDTNQNMESLKNEENININVGKYKESGKDGMGKNGGGESRRGEERAAAVPVWLSVLAAALVSSTLLQGCLAIVVSSLTLSRSLFLHAPIVSYRPKTITELDSDNYIELY